MIYGSMSVISEVIKCDDGVPLKINSRRAQKLKPVNGTVSL